MARTPASGHGTTSRTGATIGTAPERAMAGLLFSIERARHALAARVPLGTADMRLLWLFADGQPRTMREIGQQLALEQSTVHRQVTSACKEGYLDKRESPESTAAVIVATDKGHRAFEDGVAMAMRITGAGLAGLDDDEVASLLDLLGRFVADYTPAAIAGIDARDS